jgi:dynein heavy chain
MTQRDKLGKEIEYMEMMLDRATRLISGLAGEKIRWEETVKVILLILIYLFKKIDISSFTHSRI